MNAYAKNRIRNFVRDSLIVTAKVTVNAVDETVTLTKETPTDDTLKVILDLDVSLQGAMTAIKLYSDEVTLVDEIVIADEKKLGIPHRLEVTYGVDSEVVL